MNGNIAPIEDEYDTRKIKININTN